MLRFLPLTLDWDPRSLEGKFSTETLKLKEKTEIKQYSEMSPNIEKNTLTS